MFLKDITQSGDPDPAGAASALRAHCAALRTFRCGRTATRHSPHSRRIPAALGSDGAAWKRTAGRAAAGSCVTPASRPARGRGGWQRDAPGDDSRSRPPGSRGAQRVGGGGLRVLRDGRWRSPPSGQRPPPRRRRPGRNRGRRAPPSGGCAALRLPAPPAGPAGGSGGPGLSLPAALRPVPSLPAAGGGARRSADSQELPGAGCYSRPAVAKETREAGAERQRPGAGNRRCAALPSATLPSQPRPAFAVHRLSSGKAGGRGQEVRGRRSTAADGGAARSPWHTAAGRHPRLGRGRRDSTGSGRRGNRDRGEGGRQGTMLGSDRCISMPLCAVQTAPLPPPSAGAAAGLRLRPQLGAQTPARSPGASILWVRSSAARRAAPC